MEKRAWPSHAYFQKNKYLEQQIDCIDACCNINSKIWNYFIDFVYSKIYDR